MAAGVGKIRDVLRRGGGFQVAILVGNTDDGVCVADVNPLRIVSRRIESDAIRAGYSVHVYRGFAGLAIRGDSAEHLDFAAAAFRQENIAVGGGAKQSWVIESG